jgi:hypothetical protein
MNSKCKHRDTWLVCGAWGEWCYRCGAFRGMSHVKGKENSVTSRTTWVRPVGEKGDNPYSKMRTLKK